MRGETYRKMRVTVFDGLQLAKKVSGKPGWKVNGTRCFGSIQRKISWSKGTSEKVVFFRTECFNGNSCSISSKPCYRFYAFAAVVSNTLFSRLGCVK